MKTAIVYTSATGNTKILAEIIEKQVTGAIYSGNPSDAALEADTIYVGFWAKAFSCDDSIQAFLGKCENKTIFLFGTAGYDDTEEYFQKILTAVKSHIPASNTVVGEFMSMGKVSDAKQKAIQEMDMEKFQSMKANIDRAASHPDQADLDRLISALS